MGKHLLSPKDSGACVRAPPPGQAVLVGYWPRWLSAAFLSVASAFGQHREKVGTRRSARPEEEGPRRGGGSR